MSLEEATMRGYDKKDGKFAQRKIYGLIAVALIMQFCGCANFYRAPIASVPQAQVIASPPEYVIISTPADAPSGIVRYCWEEPMVKYEHNRPGVNSENTWYQPAHVAVREVRSGRWRPCEKISSSQ